MLLVALLLLPPALPLKPSFSSIARQPDGCVGAVCLCVACRAAGLAVLPSFALIVHAAVLPGRLSSQSLGLLLLNAQLIHTERAHHAVSTWCAFYRLQLHTTLHTIPSTTTLRAQVLAFRYKHFPSCRDLFRQTKCRHRRFHTNYIYLYLYSYC